MSRSVLFRNLARAMRVARYCEQEKISTSEGLERVAAVAAGGAQPELSRRDFLVGVGKLAVAGTVGWIGWPLRQVVAAQSSNPNVSVAVIGAGLAGLACAGELKRNGLFK